MTSPLLWLLLLAFPVGVGGGQIMLKLAARRMATDAPLWMALLDPVLLGAAALYGALGIVWFIILKHIPLNTAYPFVALSFVVTPLLAWQVLGERPVGLYFLGIALICAGVAITQRAVYAG
jgi:undecaprenyl phosphate-alpha-L-ara4N flippase subunit ArnE